MKTTDLSSLGWSDFFQGARQQADRPDLLTVRITADHGGLFRIDGDTGPATARPPPGPPPCVGDWVLARRGAGDEHCRIELVLARRTELVRKAAGAKTQRQTVAANLDVVFVVTDLGDDFNVRRLERYFAAVRGGGAEAVVVLNKADLHIGAEGRRLRELDPSWPVAVTSAVADIGLDELRAHLGPGRTTGFVGSSGVGKSSLVNALLHREAQRVDHVAEDGKGRHTTTHRELIGLPDGGGVLIDTPGMRELSLWDGDGLSAVFGDLEELAEQCRFRDCGHQTEPGCALLDAVDAGEVDPGRITNWRKLQRQVAYETGRQDQQQRKREAKILSKRIRKMVRDLPEHLR